MRESSPASHGFTLTDTLVSMGVIAILIAVLVPTVAGARRRSEMAAGAAHLRGVLGLFQVRSQSLGDVWPTTFRSDDPIADLSFGHTAIYSDRVLTQTVLWAPAVMSPKLGDLDPAVHQALVTPKLHRELPETAWPNDARLNNPQYGAGLSYLYSPALFTRSEMWDPGHPERREDPDAFRMRVPLAAVRSPSLKAALFERADHYGTRARMGCPDEYAAGTAWHIGFCDGSVRRIGPSGFEPPIAIEWVIDTEDRLPPTIPCATTAHGFLGRDVR